DKGFVCGNQVRDRTSSINTLLQLAPADEQHLRREVLAKHARDVHHFSSRSVRRLHESPSILAHNGGLRGHAGTALSLSGSTLRAVTCPFCSSLHRGCGGQGGLGRPHSASGQRIEQCSVLTIDRQCRCPVNSDGSPCRCCRAPP